MPTVKATLLARVRDALERLDLDPEAAEVSAAADSRFGDYQSNSAMVLAKRERRNPRDLAGQLAGTIDVSGISATPEIAGPGFLNFRLTDEFLADRMRGLLADARCGVELDAAPQTILIDFSSPNVAKPMHVGHIRSTVIGDCLARIARFLGHRVITDNHIGDWGTGFGKVIHGWKHLLDSAALERDPINELVRLYRDVNALEESDPEVRKSVRTELVKLQAGDPENREIWSKVVELSWSEFQKIYERLGIGFDQRLGESFYNDALAPLVNGLLGNGIARVSEGAVAVFFPEDSDLADKPCLIRKSDGGFLYATTDLATIEYRISRWNPDAIWYVTGAPQALHFKQVFATARMMGIRVNAHHIAFGSILGDDRKIMKTRSGENVAFADVLDESVSRAGVLVAAKNPELPPDEAAEIAGRIGIGAVKYAELSNHRMTDYVFSWDKMLSFQGNTAPYLQNACVRIQSIFRKADEAGSSRGEAGNPFGAVTPSDAERALMIKLLAFGETLPVVLTEFRPNLLANYLYELAIAFHAFYEACPVLKSEGATRDARLAICELTSRNLRTGLDLMGIQVPERM